MPGVLAVYTGADLVAAGVKPIALPRLFKRPDGQPDGQRRPSARWRIDFVRFVGEAGGGRGGRKPRQAAARRGRRS